MNFFPPISIVLGLHGHPHLIDCLNSCMITKNKNAMKHIAHMLRALALDHITVAFVKGVEKEMICYKCKKKVTSIDALCYCPELSFRECHHGDSCCNNRKILATIDEITKAYRERMMMAYHPDKNPYGEAMTRLFTKANETLTDTYKKAIYDQQMYNYATFDQEEPTDFAVVEEPVFPKFGKLLKMNKCEGLAKMMEQLSVNAAAAPGGLSDGKLIRVKHENLSFFLEDMGLLPGINTGLQDVGLNNMMETFNGVGRGSGTVGE
uniref:J domain-containing protein n=1 Tax=Globodera pallida TaxID=36090 RepID=A0A183BNB2_GLOPA